MHRADLLLARGALDRAAADVEHGLALAPDHARLRAAQGALFAELGDVEAAYESYSTALHADPTCVAAWANRAVLAFEAGRTEDAVGDLDAALALVGDPELRANRAVALQALGEHRRAVADLDRVLAAAAPSRSRAAVPAGASRFALGDAAGAVADWRSPHLAALGADDVSPHAERDRGAGRDDALREAGVSGDCDVAGPSGRSAPIWCARAAVRHAPRASPSSRSASGRSGSACYVAGVALPRPPRRCRSGRSGCGPRRGRRCGTRPG
ncbi:tetratricopeptide repeat protein [Streptomyces sp. KL116D]|uniref:tetratricopeptide repeat protein n=1 Tax=Streptomyces sp. KL116D TaxID=3045152 RepID=UPI003557EC77